RGESTPADVAGDSDVARAWMRGETVDWAALYAGEVRRRVPLPFYPWQRERFWPDHAGAQPAATADDRLYTLDWVPQPHASTVPLPSPGSLVQACRPWLEARASAPEIAETTRLFEQLERATPALLAAALRDGGAPPVVSPTQARLFARVQQ